MEHKKRYQYRKISGFFYSTTCEKSSLVIYCDKNMADDIIQSQLKARNWNNMPNDTY